MKNKGFTLIELIVVILIIAILMSLFIFSYKTAISKAKIMSCAQNMKVIWQSLFLYTEDYPDESRPPGSDAREIYGSLYYPQTRGRAGGITNLKTFVCPATRHLQPTSAKYGGKLACDATNANLGYYNPDYLGSSIDYWIVKKQRIFNDITHFDIPDFKTIPAQNVLLIEASSGINYHHKNGRNLAYMNGSVKFIASLDVSQYPVNIFHGSGTSNDGMPEQNAGAPLTVASVAYVDPNQ